MSASPGSSTAIRATYRLQFNARFTFRDATELVPYLAELGISHIYASPIMEARPGSTHGYDIIDHNRLNPEIGTEEDFRVLIDALHAHDMGLLLDFVPNHMGVGSDNAWWLDVLEWGQDSPFAPYFDINWDPVRPDLKDRVLLPVVGDHYGIVLEKGEIALRFEREDGSFSAWYYEHRFPISPRSYPMILEAGDKRLADLTHEFAALGEYPAERARKRASELKQRLARRAREPAFAAAIDNALKQFAGEPGYAASFEPLHRLLEQQSYRIAHWRVAAEEINYRRFFNINDLAGLRMELPELFERTHRLVFKLIERGDVQGLRIDHIDGLFDPKAYCEQLQQRFPEPHYVLVEKILARYEVLPAWPVAGTTGYDFVNQALAIFVDPAGEAAMTRLYRRFADGNDDFDDVLYASKKRITQVNLASEVNVLAHEFHRLSMRNWRTRDFTLNGMLSALIEVIAAFPVYRTYVSLEGASADDRRYIEWALAQAKKRWRIEGSSIFDFLHGVLTGEPAAAQLPSDHDEALRVAMHFQQVTGPVMAKAAEDTAFYRYFRLLALNEVGGDPRRFGMSIAAFHHGTQERARAWPRAMVTTATHDTKRGEDGRVRLALLSEMPREWGRRVTQWSRLNRSRRSELDGKIVPDRNIEYLFYQTLLGAWPPDLAPGEFEGMKSLAERLEGYMIKAVREGKQQSSWSNPDLAYEAALQHFVQAALDATRPNPFLWEFHAFVESAERLGAISSLAQLVLKLTVPGVPDIYQGGELWDFSLVDPDNRRPVAWNIRRTLLEVIDDLSIANLQENWRDGREKLFVARRLLQQRRISPELFAEGTYQPLDVVGEASAHICAFARTRACETMVVAVPRLVHQLYQGDQAAHWGGTEICLPSKGTWRDIFTGRTVGNQERIPVSGLLADFPVCVLVGKGGREPKL
ncbi:MAG: malto-oligosyltrehalose synthase [Alphaproteobacteria bacterium]|nr:malto-oligosyltrehalose synthase [Alphaproteobacteria bacterium]